MLILPLQDSKSGWFCHWFSHLKELQYQIQKKLNEINFILCFYRQREAWQGWGGGNKPWENTYNKENSYIVIYPSFSFWVWKKVTIQKKAEYKLKFFYRMTLFRFPIIPSLFLATCNVSSFLIIQVYVYALFSYTE